MKYSLIFYLFIISFSINAQDEIKMDSTDYKKNFFVVSGSVLYNIYQGRKEFEFPATLQSVNSAYPTKYIEYEYVNTSGFYINGAYRHFFTKKMSVQNGINLSYQTEKNIHHDSLKNKNNSPLKSIKASMYILDYGFYLNYRIYHITLSSGIMLPIIMYKYYSNIYYDKTVAKNNRGFDFGKFYLSENIQFQLFKKQNLTTNFGIDISPELIFQKHPNGYLLLLNAGIGWFFEKKSNQRKQEVDYIK